MTVVAGRGQSIAYASSIFIAFAALVLSRKPDAFLRSQFWAEDGVVWYRQAYEIGWMSLLLPQNGYFQSVSKIAGNLGQLVSLTWAPLLFALIALLFKLLPVMLLYSARGKALVPRASGRFLLSFLYVAHPYSWEVFINVTNIHWHLALAALLILCFASWDRTFQKISDLAIVLLCGLSGTFAFFLAPISAWHWYSTKSRRSLILASILFLAAGIQLAALLMTGAASRSSAPLDASWSDLLRIVGGQITAASILGDGWLHLFESRLWQGSVFFPFAFSAVLAVFMARALQTADHALRYLVVLSVMIFVAALLQPQISSTQGQWPLFARPNTGGRYAFIPILGFYASLAWIGASDRSIVYRRIAQALLAAVLVAGVPMSWRVKAYEDVGFLARAKAFEQAPPGEIVEIPTNPRGWSFSLEKR